MTLQVSSHYMDFAMEVQSLKRPNKGKMMINLIRPVCTVGIDYALAAPHCFSVRWSGHEPQPAVSVASDRASVRAFFDNLLEEAGPATRVAVAFEGSGRQLNELLETIEGIELYPINPLASQMARRARHVSGIKSDPIDAAVLRSHLEQNLDELKSAVPLDRPSAELALLCEDRRGLVEERKAVGNRMINAVRHDCPALAAGFGSYSKSFISLLVKWPELDKLARTRPSTVRKYLRSIGPIKETKLQAVLDAVTGIDPKASGIRWKLAVSQARLAEVLEQEIVRYEVQIKELYKTHPLHELIESLPGTGAALGPRLCGFLGVDPNRWQTAEVMQLRSGVAPVLSQSGKAPLRTSRRRACRKHDLQTFVEFARCSTFSCDWAKAFLDAQRAKGKSANTAYRALAFKWIRIIHACIKTDSLYDESKIKSLYQPSQAVDNQQVANKNRKKVVD
jgi:transposase